MTVVALHIRREGFRKALHMGKRDNWTLYQTASYTAFSHLDYFMFGHATCLDQ